MQSKSLVGETCGYHLFLMPPEGPFKDALQSVIRNLAEKYGGLVFEPHITLAAEIEAPLLEITSLASRLAKQEPPLVTFHGVETGTTFFTCCYISIEKTSQLAKLSRLACEQFSITRVFNPHLSLAYGVYPPEVTRAMAAFAEETLAELLVPAVFPTLELWETKGRIDEWKMLHRYSLAT